MNSSINPGAYSRFVGGLLDTATNAGRYYRSTPNPSVLDFLEQNADGVLAQPDDIVRVPPSAFTSLNNGNVVTSLPMMPDNGQVDPQVVNDGSVIRDYQLNNNLAMQTQPALTNQTEPTPNQGVLANTAPASGNRRDQTPMSLKPQTIDNNELMIRMGGAGLAANRLGATAALGASIDEYGKVMDANRKGINDYNLAVAKAEAKAKGKGNKTGSAGDLYGSIVVNDAIDRALPLIDNFTAGLGGTMLSKIPGTDATNLSKLIDSVKANAGFDKLQAMRDASPTGGALGQVSDKEIKFLQSVFGSLDQDQSPKQLKYNLELFRYVYSSMIHGEDGHSYSPPAGAEVMINKMRVSMEKDPLPSSQPAAAGNLSAADAIVGIN